MRKEQPDYTAKRNEEIARLYGQGATIQSLAAKFNLNPRFISMILTNQEGRRTKASLELSPEVRKRTAFLNIMLGLNYFLAGLFLLISLIWIVWGSNYSTEHEHQDYDPAVTTQLYALGAFCLGIAILLGGWNWKVQQFSRTARNLKIILDLGLVVIIGFGLQLYSGEVIRILFILFLFLIPLFDIYVLAFHEETVQLFRG
ncbi:MAG: hypothetical protein ACFFB3_14380 [Candidatus Hodarchaeota archaeon]